MKTFQYELKRHSIRNVPVVEVFQDGQLVATITESQDGGSLRVVSKYLLPSQPRPHFDPRFQAADGRVIGTQEVWLKIEVSEKVAE